VTSRRPREGGDPASLQSFAARLVAWQREHGRNGLPWQHTRDPYLIWLSEVMLQQTQVATVLPYYERFVESFPDVRALASAPIDHVLQHWSGLGYYRRAHHLHAAAKAIVERHGGTFPRDVEAIAALPGIGRSTAAAIAAFAFGTRAAILDGNVKRVLARHRGIDGFPGAPRVERRLWAAADAVLPDKEIERYTQGMMDLGATVCTRTPACLVCPVNADCVARVEGRIDALPASRPTRSLPHRNVRVLVLECGNAMLLERRPPTGVWSGLFSFPEAALEEDALEVARARFHVDATPGPAVEPITHGFTHFTLTLHPQRLAVTAWPRSAEESGHVWLTRADALTAALPAPIKRLVRSLDQ
jgi:A/G-specific adenine glycosylase